MTEAELAQIRAILREELQSALLTRDATVAQREEETEYIASLQGLPWQEAVARNRARNKRM